MNIVKLMAMELYITRMVRIILEILLTVLYVEKGFYTGKMEKNFMMDVLNSINLTDLGLCTIRFKIRYVLGFGIKECLCCGGQNFLI